MKLPTLVLIEWLDSAQPIPGWSYLADPPKLEVVRCVSVGWLVAENDSVKMLAPNIGDFETDSAQGSGFMRIPVASVVRQAELVEK